MTREELYDEERLRNLSDEEFWKFFDEHMQRVPEMRRRHRERIEDIRRIARGLPPIYEA